MKKIFLAIFSFLSISSVLASVSETHLQFTSEFLSWDKSKQKERLEQIFLPETVNSAMNEIQQQTPDCRKDRVVSLLDQLRTVCVDINNFDYLQQTINSNESKYIKCLEIMAIDEFELKMLDQWILEDRLSNLSRLTVSLEFINNMEMLIDILIEAIKLDKLPKLEYLKIHPTSGYKNFMNKKKSELQDFLKANSKVLKLDFEDRCVTHGTHFFAEIP